MEENQRDMEELEARVLVPLISEENDLSYSDTSNKMLSTDDPRLILSANFNELDSTYTSHNLIPINQIFYNNFINFHQKNFFC